MLELSINNQAGECVRLEDTRNWQSWASPYQCYIPLKPQHGDNPAPSISYFSPASCSTPAMAGQYSYPPPDGQGNASSGSNMDLPPLNLPPIRNLDGSQQPQPPQQQQQQQGQQGAQASIPVIPPTMNQYYGQQSQPFPPSSDPNAPQRWPIPPDGRVMSGGRHKKEIKRRTKTGCLTCRKRRIKVCERSPRCACSSTTIRDFTFEEL